MALTVESKLRKEFGIPNDNLILIKAFLQGAVYSWVKNRKDEVFAARDLVGGENFDWTGTPLYCLYQKHIEQGKTNQKAIDEAGKDVGWILKAVLHEDKRTFETCDRGLSNGYRWLGNEA